MKVLQDHQHPSVAIGRHPAVLVFSLLLGAVAAACGGGSTTTPVVVAPSIQAAPPSPATPAATPGLVATAAPSSTPDATAAAMPASLVGTWAGTVTEPRGIVKEYAETYVIEPCAATGACGSFELQGPVVEERLDTYPWARMGLTWRCSGVIKFDKMDEHEALFVAAAKSADPPESIGTCGNMPFGLAPTADGGLTFTGYAWGKTILQRGLLLPVTQESPSAAAALDQALVGTWTGEVDVPFKVLGPIPEWTVTYTLAPCVSGEECGTWTWQGRVTETGDTWPWAVLGAEVSCSGPLEIDSVRDGMVVLWGPQSSFQAEGGHGCGDWHHRLQLTSDDTLRLEFGEDAIEGKRGYGTLQRTGG